MPLLKSVHVAFLQANSLAVTSYLPILGPALAECLKDGNTPVRLAAERCILHVFQITKGISFFILTWVIQK